MKALRFNGENSLLFGRLHRRPNNRPTILWYRADRGVVLDDNNRLTLWKDQSGRRNWLLDHYDQIVYALDILQFICWSLCAAIFFNGHAG